MHGNTETSTGGPENPALREHLKELDTAFPGTQEWVPTSAASTSELTGDDVTECTGGARGLTDTDLQRAYRSQVDPRLNHEQALELAMLIAERKPEPPRRANAEH